MNIPIVIASGLLCCLPSAALAQQPGGGPPSGSGAPAQTSSQGTATAAATNSPAPLSTPPITGPLQASSPITIDGGPLGTLSLDGVLSGFGLVQSHHTSGDQSSEAALNNAQIFLQKADGRWQFYIQAGAYNILTVGTPFLSTGKQVSDLYGPVPVAYFKLAPAKNTSIEIGALPTLMGAESTFDFQNMDIERGILWNQENAINRGIQLSQTFRKVTASISWNDGYYSNRYSWISGSLTYANGPHSINFDAMGNLGHTAFQALATPVQNNSTMYVLEYTYSKGNWIAQPYFQYSDVPTDPKVGIAKGASTSGGALLLSHTFKHGFSLAGRGEYISTTGSTAEGSVNLLYGPGSSSWSLTATPTYQRRRFFARGDIAAVRAVSFVGGDAFGVAGTDATQVRGMMEVGFLF